MSLELISTKKQRTKGIVKQLVHNKQERRKKSQLWDNCPKVNLQIINDRKAKRKSLRLPQISAEVKERQKNSEIITEATIVGNELLVFISLVDLAHRLGLSYTTSIQAISKKCGLQQSEVRKHIKSLHKKAVIKAKKQHNELYHIELADDSAMYEPSLVRFYQSITKGEE